MASRCIHSVEGKPAGDMGSGAMLLYARPGWAGGLVHAARNRARGMALEYTGWEATVRWAWHWSVDIRQMLEDLANWLAGGEPEAAD